MVVSFNISILHVERSSTPTGASCQEGITVSQLGDHHQITSIDVIHRIVCTLEDKSLMHLVDIQQVKCEFLLHSAHVTDKGVILPM